MSGLTFEADGTYAHISNPVDVNDPTNLNHFGIIYDIDGSLTGGVGGGVGYPPQTGRPYPGLREF